MGSNITLANRPEKRVDERVQQNIRIRMAPKPCLVRNFYSAQNQFSAAVQPVHVEAVPNAKFLRHGKNLCLGSRVKLGSRNSKPQTSCAASSPDQTKQSTTGFLRTI